MAISFAIPHDVERMRGDSFVPGFRSPRNAEALPESDQSDVCARLTRRCLDAIERTDPQIRAVLRLNERAQREATLADQRRANRTSISPLDGVPVLVKDNIDTADLGCTAGSRVLARAAPPARDAPVIQKMRSLGVVLLGKTNLSEWGSLRSTCAIEGWSGVGGQTVNPHRTLHSPGGSSSGSAAAVAAGMAPMALGTESDGSIIAPAALNGVVGVKPERGLLPIEGVVPVSPDRDVVGVFAGQLNDAALLVAALSGRPPTRPAEPADPRALRVGICPAPWLPAVAIDEAAATLRSDGAEVIEIDFAPDEQITEDALIATLGGFARALPAYLARRTGAPDSLASLIASNREDPIELAVFGQEIFEFVAGMDADEIISAHAAAERARKAARDYLDATLHRHRLDALIAPANSPAKPIRGSVSDNGEPSFTTLPASAGYPHIALPISSVEGLPVGVSVFGPATLAALLPIAAAIERACPAFRIAAPR